MMKIIILGASGGCLDLLDLIIDLNKIGKRYDIIGILDNRCIENNVLGYPILGGFEEWVKFSEDHFFVTAVGSEKNFYNRSMVINKIPKYRYVTLIHPTAVISNFCKISNHGVVLHSGVKIATNAIIGDFVLILSNSIINHDATVSEYALINTACNIAGNVFIGESCYIGAGTVINPNIKIQNSTLVGSGSLVTKNLESNAVYYGVPTRKIRDLK